MNTLIKRRHGKRTVALEANFANLEVVDSYLHALAGILSAEMGMSATCCFYTNRCSLMAQK